MDIITSENVVTLHFTVKNTGTLPATNVNTYVDFFQKNEEITENNRSRKYSPITTKSEAAMVFPNQSVGGNIGLKISNTDDKQLWEDIVHNEVNLRISIQYKGISQEYITVQAVKIETGMEGKQIHLIPVTPQKRN